MPPKKETHSEKAARHRELALQLKLKSALARVTGVLKANGQKLLEVEAELVSSGHLDAELAFTPTRAVAGSNAQFALLNGEAEDPDDKPFCKNITTWGDLSLALSKRMLTAAEPVSMSAANLKMMITRGQREVSMAELHKLREYMTGISGDEVIEPECRTNNSVIQFFSDLNLKCGRRARDLILLVSWETDGIYSVSVGLDCIMSVRNKFTDTVVEVQCPRNAKFVVDMNYSETRAIVKQASGPWRKNISQLFLAACDEGGGKETRSCVNEGRGERAGVRCVGRRRYVKSAHVTLERQVRRRVVSPSASPRLLAPLPAANMALLPAIKDDLADVDGNTGAAQTSGAEPFVVPSVDAAPVGDGQSTCDKKGSTETMQQDATTNSGGKADATKSYEALFKPPKPSKGSK